MIAVFFGLLASTIRWLVIDAIHHRTGITKPSWDLHKLGDRTDGFESLVEYHYRFYQFHANSIIAIVFHFAFHLREMKLGLFDAVSVVLVLIVLFVGSRDCLNKYYRRVEALLAD